MATAAAFDDPKTYAHIDLRPVKSNKIKSVGYDASSKTLAVAFQYGAGAIYHYPDIEQKVFDDFMAAESKGSFFGKHLQTRAFRKYKPEALNPHTTKEKK